MAAFVFGLYGLILGVLAAIIWCSASILLGMSVPTFNQASALVVLVGAIFALAGGALTLVRS